MSPFFPFLKKKIPFGLKFCLVQADCVQIGYGYRYSEVYVWINFESTMFRSDLFYGVLR